MEKLQDVWRALRGAKRRKRTQVSVLPVQRNAQWRQVPAEAVASLPLDFWWRRPGPFGLSQRRVVSGIYASANGAANGHQEGFDLLPVPLEPRDRWGHVVVAEGGVRKDLAKMIAVQEVLSEENLYAISQALDWKAKFPPVRRQGVRAQQVGFFVLVGAFVLITFLTIVVVSDLVGR